MNSRAYEVTTASNIRHFNEGLYSKRKSLEIVWGQMIE